MKFLIAPDSFKESMSASQACTAIARGIKEKLPDAETVLLPLADGGEGTLDVLISALSGEVEHLTVTGPLFSEVQARAGIVKDNVGIIEIAEAAGLHLVPPKDRNPEDTTSRGVGEMIRQLLDNGVRHFLIGLGGSATNDGGLGVLYGLGAVARDGSGQILEPVGSSLYKISRLDLSKLDSRLSECHFMLACDVDNPLTGERGASFVFGPQKGASKEQVESLDKGLMNWAEVLNETFGRDVASVPGSGAAGGMAALFLAAFDTSLKPGIEQVLDIVDFEQQCTGADWVITGEGSLDNQSLAGKTPVGVARRAHALGVPVVAFAGKLGEGFEAVYEEGIDLALCITPDGMAIEEALSRAEDNICQASRALMDVLFQRSEHTNIP